MNKVVLIVIFLIATLLSYVVYAVTQGPENRKTADEIIARIVNPELDESRLAEKQITQPDSQTQTKSLFAIDLKQPQPKTEVRQRYFVRSMNQQSSHANESASAKADRLQAPIELSIAPIKNEDQAWIRGVEISFTNVSPDPIKIIKPLDGSYYGWYQPHYKFTATDSAGKPLELMGRCGLSGLWHETTFPESYLVELQPKESHKVSGYLPFAVRETGQHQISFEYIYNYEDNQANPPKNADEAAWTKPVKGVWQGTLKSNAIELKLKKTE